MNFVNEMVKAFRISTNTVRMQRNGSTGSEVRTNLVSFSTGGCRHGINVAHGMGGTYV